MQLMKHSVKHVSKLHPALASLTWQVPPPLLKAEFKLLAAALLEKGQQVAGSGVAGS